MRGLGAAPPQGQAPQQPAPQPQAAGQPMQQPAQGGTPDAQEATPEQRAQFDQFVSTGMAILFDPQFVNTARQRIEGDDNPIDAVAEVATNIVNRIFTEAMKQGEDIDQLVVLHGGWQILNYVAEVAQVGAGVEMAPEDIETAFYLAADKFRKMLEAEGLMEPIQDPQEGYRKAVQIVGDEQQLQSGVQRAMAARRQVPGAQA